MIRLAKSKNYLLLLFKRTTDFYCYVYPIRFTVLRIFSSPDIFPPKKESLDLKQYFKVMYGYKNSPENKKLYFRTTFDREKDFNVQ